MKNVYLFSLVLAMLAVHPHLAAQTTHRPNSILLSLGAESNSLSLSYETKILDLSNQSHLLLKGFVGYGFNYSSRHDLDEIKEPGRLPASSLRLSTYYPFSAHRDSERAIYYLGDLKQYTLGLELAGRYGKRHHFLELGYGIGLDYFTRPVNFYSDRNRLGNKPTFDQLKASRGSRIASHHFGRMGYRFVASSGITLGAGVSLLSLEGLFTRFYAADRCVNPYLSLGYSF